MESVIIYELARNNVYGSLSRALGGLQQNCMGMLAAERARIKPAFKNDLYFYHQVRIGHTMLAMLQEFCDGRLKGESYEDARRHMVGRFTAANGPAFDEDSFKLFAGSYRDEMEGATDQAKEEMYRYRHLDEFRTVLHVLDRYLHQGGLKTWASEIIFNQIYNRLDSFVDPQVADKGFDKFPIPAEVQHLADATRWLKKRAVMAQAKAMPFISITTPGQSGIFGRLSGDSLADKLRFAQYAVHCETIGASIAAMIGDGGFVPLLGSACKIPRGYLPATFISVTAKIQVDLPKVLPDLLSQYKESFAKDVMKIGYTPDFCAASVAAIDDVIADFVEEHAADAAATVKLPGLSARRQKEQKPKPIPA